MLKSLFIISGVLIATASMVKASGEYRGDDIKVHEIPLGFPLMQKNQEIEQQVKAEEEYSATCTCEDLSSEIPRDLDNVTGFGSKPVYAKARAQGKCREKALQIHSEKFWNQQIPTLSECPDEWIEKVQ